MGRVGQFVRRHWLGILSLAGVGVAVARPDLLQDATERVLQGVLNALVIVLEVAMTAIANTVARNGQLLENLMVLGFIIFGLKIVFRGLFRKSSKK